MISVTGPLTKNGENAAIGVTLGEGHGNVFTLGYGFEEDTGNNLGVYPAVSDASYFFDDAGALSVGLEKNNDNYLEAAMMCPWKQLQDQIDHRQPGDDGVVHITMTADLKPHEDDGDTALVVSAGRKVEIEMNGHTIDRGLAEKEPVEGGNIFTVEEGASLCIHNGTLTGGNNKGNGGAIVSHGTVIAENMCFVENHCTKYGGGAVIFGNAVLEGSEISRNTAENGGGVAVYGTVEMSHAEITGNTCTVNGGGVFVARDGMLNLRCNAGMLYIRNNHRDAFHRDGGAVRNAAQENNVYLSAGTRIDIDGTLGSGSSIGVTTELKPDPENGLVDITDGLNVNNLSAFVSDEGYTVSLDGDQVAIGRDIIKDVDVTATGYGGVYDGQPHGITVSVKSPSGASVKYGKRADKCDQDKIEYTDAGTNETVYFQVTAKGYWPETDSKQVVISQKPVGLDWTNTEFTYDGKAHIPTAAATGLIGSDKCTVTVTGEQTKAGSYTATATGLSNGNYRLPDKVTRAFTIKPAKLTITADSAEKVYDGAALEQNTYTTPKVV